MKKLLKILVGVFVALVIVALLMPDTKKDAAGATSLAETGTATETAAPEAPAEKSKPELEILKQNDENGAYGIEGAHEIHVKVRNNSGELMQFVSLKGVFYDKKDNIVGTGAGIGSNIAAGASKTIDISATGIEGADHYEVEIGSIVKD